MQNRTHQILLICTFLPLCWLLMQAVHELGHVACSLATGGTISRVVLNPLTISRTDTSGSATPLLVIWAGPVVGVVLPLLLLAVAKVFLRLFGLLALPAGLYLWNGLGPQFGLGRGQGLVDRRAAYLSAALLAIVACLELAFGS